MIVNANRNGDACHDGASAFSLIWRYVRAMAYALSTAMVMFDDAAARRYYACLTMAELFVRGCRHVSPRVEAFACLFTSPRAVARRGVVTALILRALLTPSSGDV